MLAILDFMVFYPKEKDGAKYHPSLLDLGVGWENSKRAIAVCGLWQIESRSSYGYSRNF